MSNQSMVRAFAIAALVVAVSLAIGIGAYNAGVAHGIVESGRITAAPSGAPFAHGWPHHWGFGFGFFPFFFLLFGFLLLRRLLWRGGPWRGGYGCRFDGVPPAFDEWHRRAHAQSETPSTGTRTTT
jgi:hypothetical protein